MARFLFQSFLWILFINLSLSHAIASISVLPPISKKEFVTVINGDCGMFRTLASLLGVLHRYEEGHYAGVKVDFGQDGPYYDPLHGSNWWEYFFEPLYLGNEIDAIPKTTLNGPVGDDYAMLTEFYLTRKQNYDLLTKYVHIKPQIITKVSKFSKKHFKNHSVIGVHYRGTDKWSEAPRASYERMLDHVFKTADKFHLKRYKVFVATDEQDFIKYMRSVFSENLLYLKRAHRSSSGDPVHLTGGDRYKKGEEALLDCLLLSHCKALIKTSSNLSLFSMYFNPTMPVIHVTARHWRDPLDVMP